MSDRESTPEPPKSALLIVDVQNDFISGSLPVPDAQSVIPEICKMIDAGIWDAVVYTQDWHPQGHISFASTHNTKPYQAIQVPHPVLENQTITQMLWPDHCVQNTEGSKVHPAVQAKLDESLRTVYCVRKGDDPNIDGYSAFSKNEYVGFTNLNSILAKSNIETVIVCGLATDYCVRASALDARKFGYDTVLVADAIRGVNPEGSKAAIAELEKWGCRVVECADDAIGIASGADLVYK